VHAHLLCERSESLKAAVERAVATDCLTFGAFYVSDSAARMYLGFLYGNPMWTNHSEGNRTAQHVNNDWRDLTRVHDLGMYHEDYDAVDAALDGMRNLLRFCRNHLSDPFLGNYEEEEEKFAEPHGRLILDFMVHKDCNFREWMQAYDRSYWDADINKALSKKFAEESQRIADEIAEPDLLKRCRYHLHVEYGTPCYLDK
jgi:hypothetical protein